MLEITGTWATYINIYMCMRIFIRMYIFIHIYMYIHIYQYCIPQVLVVCMYMYINKNRSKYIDQYIYKHITSLFIYYIPFLQGTLRLGGWPLSVM
jgi:hypothetical protein